MELNEEEKEAIETLKEVASDDFDTLGDDISPKMAQNILSVIDKLQKNIEELIKINTPMSWEMKDKDGNVVMSLKKPDNYISKDKIREAIKDREIELYADNPEDTFIPFDEVIYTLKQLLEESTNE